MYWAHNTYITVCCVNILQKYDSRPQQFCRYVVMLQASVRDITYVLKRLAVGSWNTAAL